MHNSPYKDLGSAKSFLEALKNNGRTMTTLIGQSLRDRLPVITSDLDSHGEMSAGHNAQEIAALPIGGRVKLDPWNDHLQLIKAKPVRRLQHAKTFPSK